LGSAVGDQISEVIETPDDATISQQNYNALSMAQRRFLHTVMNHTEPDEDDALREQIVDLTDLMQRSGVSVSGF
jgi:TRAP-type C4-dicarboxylate transport system substrate-binding protein